MAGTTHAHQTRRDWLKRAGLGVLGGAALGRVAGAAALVQEYGPFKMGIQSYSLRHFPVDEALAKTKDLGLHYWESYSAHIPPDPRSAPEARLRAAGFGVSVNGFGVVRFTADHDANRKLFEFGKALGVSYLSADPTPDAFDSLDKLVEEYGIPVGIHNHGPGHHFEKIATIMLAIEDHSPKIGCCIDTGHFLRSREDPVEAAVVFKNRIYGVHLKDVKDATTFTVLGEGDLKTAELLSELARQKYDYCLALEYEEKPEDPIADIQACLKATRAALPAP